MNLPLSGKAILHYWVKIKQASGKHMSHLLEGSLFNVSVSILAAGIGFINSFILAKFYGPEILGKIAVIANMAALGSTLALFGSDTLTLRMLPEQLKLNGVGGALAVYKRLSIIGIIGVVAFLFLWWCIDAWFANSASALKDTSQYTLLIALLILVAMLRKMNNKTLRGLGDYKYFSLVDISPAVLILFVLLVCLGISVKEETLVQLYFIPNFIVCLMSFFLVVKIFLRLEQTRVDIPEISVEKRTLPPGLFDLYRLSTPMFGVTLSSALILYMDILMVNYFMGAESAGIYSVYVKLVSISAIAIGSINSMFAPKVATLFAGNELADLRVFSKRTTLLAFGVSVIGACGMLLIHRHVLNHFGEPFTQELPALYILLGSSVISAYFGSIGLFLSMTGDQVTFFWIMLMAAVVNILGNFYLIPEYGVVGAAISTLMSLVFWKLLATVRVNRNHGYTLCWTGVK